MTLNDLLKARAIDPQRVLVLRHRPHEPELNKALPWLAADRPDVFNAYQQAQGERVERAMQKLVGVGYVASFIGREPGKALFVGLYSIGKAKPLTRQAFWRIPALKELCSLGMKGFTEDSNRRSCLWFNLVLTAFHADWKGKLVIGWPGKELSWWRRADRNDFPVLAIHEESQLSAAMPRWDAIDLTWEQLKVLPKSWSAAMGQWRGIYYIFDVSDGKGYVGSASGQENIRQRWLQYAASGHGGNRLLRKRDPRNLRFSILQRVSPDMDRGDVCQIEAAWKVRLHTHAPHGLNDN